ncbi:hypothetical protein AZJ37_02135 [Streptococcus pneumoniae]|nr:hypothetical protein AZJ37_02135 [Streptococcus pneumoniae]
MENPLFSEPSAGLPSSSPALVCRPLSAFSNTLRKSLQTTSTSPCRIYVTDFVSSIYNLKTVF